MELLFLLGGSGGLVWVLGFALWAWWLSRSRMALVAEESCYCCKTPFNDAIHEYGGRPSQAVKDRLDNFQRRHAAFVIICMECDAINVCARDGRPFKAILQQKT